MAFDWESFAQGIERTTGLVQGSIMQAYQQEKENREWERRQRINEGRIVRLEQMRFKNQKAAATSAAKLQDDLTRGRQEDLMKLQSKLALYDNSFEVMSLYEDPENPFGRVVYGDKKQKLEKGILFDDQDRKDIEEHLPPQIAMKIYDLEQVEREKQMKFQQDQSRINATAERYRMLGEKEADVKARMGRAEIEGKRVSRNQQIVQYDKDILKLQKEQTKLEQRIIKEAGIEYKAIKSGGRKGTSYRDMSEPQSLAPHPDDTPLVASYKQELIGLRKRLEELELEKMAFMEKAAGVSRTDTTYKPTPEEQAELTRLGLTYEEAKALYEKRKK